MIPVCEPYIPDTSKKYLTGAVNDGVVGACGPTLAEFELELARYHGVDKAYAVLTGTLALELAIEATKAIYEPKARVAYFETLTFIATAAACVRNRMKCNVHDVQAGNEHWSPDVRHVDVGYTRIADAAAAHGEDLSRFPVATLSFNANKPITTGQGGAILCSDPSIAEYVENRLGLCRAPQVGHYAHWDLGRNYRMPAINAALGLVQLRQLDWTRKIRKDIHDAYVSAGMNMLPTTWQAIWLTPKHPDLVICELKRQGIDARRFWLPMHMQPCRSMLGIKDGLHFERAEMIYDHAVMLPCSTGITKWDLRKVIDVCAEFV